MMNFVTLAAIMAAMPVALAANGTTTQVECWTSFATTSTFARTNTVVNTTFSTFTVDSTTRTTVSITPVAITATNIITTTTTVTSTISSTQAPRVIPKSPGFIDFVHSPIQTGAPVKRLEGLKALSLRQNIPDGSSVGFTINPAGGLEPLAPGPNGWPARVVCFHNVMINTTRVNVVTNAPVTITAAPPVQTIFSTSTATTTTTIVRVLPRRTEWAACSDDNVVNQLPDSFGREVKFNAVQFSQPIPANRILQSRVHSGRSCCIANQRTPYAAGSFYHPLSGICYIVLARDLIPEALFPGQNCSTDNTTDSTAFPRPMIPIPIPLPLPYPHHNHTGNLTSDQGYPFFNYTTNSSDITLHLTNDVTIGLCTTNNLSPTTLPPPATTPTQSSCRIFTPLSILPLPHHNSNHRHGRQQDSSTTPLFITGLTVSASGATALPLSISSPLSLPLPSPINATDPDFDDGTTEPLGSVNNTMGTAEETLADEARFCREGSRSTAIGEVRGSRDLDGGLAFVVSNGGCGYFWFNAQG